MKHGKVCRQVLLHVLGKRLRAYVDDFHPVRYTDALILFML